MTGPQVTAVEPITDELALWSSALGWADLPAATRDHLKLCLLDTIGCGLFGAEKTWGRIAAETAIESAGGTCHLWGRHETAGPAAAAMANGTAVHGFELDDVHLSGQIHPGAVVVPAVLALAGMAGADGRTMLAALAAGYEMGLRLGVAAGRGHGLSGYHPTGTLGAVAAAAAGARVLGLDREQTRAALALGATQAAGLYAARTGGMAKRFHAGHASAAGVTAALLARRGFTGADGAIEAPFGGLLATLRCDGDRSALREGIGRDWLCDGVGFKIYATCASAQTIVAGMRQLRQAGVDAGNLARLDIHMGSIAVSNVGWPYRPRDVVAAQMNGGYAAAVTLLDGDAFVEQFSDARLADADVLALVERVHFHVDPDIESGGLALRHASRILATLTDGSTRSVYNAQRPGGPGNEIAPEKVLGKFRRLAEASLGAAGCDRVIELTMGLDTLTGADALTEALVRQPVRLADARRAVT